jgi:geranylgeranylglycerol-phosphate geranylgeranyltransferase
MSETAGHGTAAAYVGLLRPGNCAMGAFGVLLAAIVCAGPSGVEENWLEVALSMAVVMAFTGAGNALNDYFDREVDKVAHPDRPLPRGLLSPRTALYLAVTLFVAAISLSPFVSIWSVTIVIASVFAMLVYEVLLKGEGLVGNLAISWLTGALFLFGGAAVDSLEVAWILALLAFLATLGREIVKDIQDIEGDRGSRRTLPMRIGVERAGAVGSAAFLGAIALSPAPYILDLMSVWYLPVVVVADGIFIYCALIHFENPEKGQKMAKLAMLVALMAFLVGGVL